MKNYFENSRVNWRDFSPQNIMVKSNSLTKKLLPSENLLSYKSKGDRDQQMAKLTGGKVSSSTGYGNHQTHNYYSNEHNKGVHVWLKDLKGEYPIANVDIVNYTERLNSAGSRRVNLDALIYINSYHRQWDWKQVNGKWQHVSHKNSCSLEEGYLIAYGGQGDNNPMTFEEFEEVLQISEAVRRFLIDVVIPAKNGEFNYDQLLVA